MNKTYKLRHLIVSFLCGSLFFSGLTFAANKNIEVSFDKLMFIVNGVDKTSSDGMFDNNGTKVPASFIYEGTTYIPMRMISNMLGKAVDWDGSKQAVIIGNSLGDGDYMSDLPLASGTGPRTAAVNQEVKLQGQTYSKSISLLNIFAEVNCNLNNKYTELTALIGTNNGAGTIIITGDGKTLFKQTFVKGSSPAEVKIDVTGVLELNISMKDGLSEAIIANPYLTLK